MAHPLPGPGRDGEEPPPPGGAARDGRERPPGVPDDALDWELVMPPEDPDYDPDAALEEIIADADAGLYEIPDERDRWAGPVLSLGGACAADPLALARLAAADGPADLGFGQGGAADTMSPGPLLDALAGQAVQGARLLGDDGLAGAISAARRLQAYAEWLELAAIAEFSARQDERFVASRARGDRPRRRDGEYPECELGMELALSPAAAASRINLAVELATRLPATFAGMRAGTVSGEKARIICGRTAHLSAGDAAIADEILAAAAPGMRPESLYKKAVRLAHKLDPDADNREKADAAATRRRVQAGREESGNASLAGRELDNADVLAARARIWDQAARLRAAGLPGSLDAIRARVYLDLLLGINPASRLHPAPAPPAGRQDPASAPPAGRQDPASAPPVGRQDPASAPPAGTGGPAGGSARDSDGEPGSGAAGITPLPALIQLIVPIGALLGGPEAMSEAGSWGLLDGGDTRAVVSAASLDPRTRWCVTAVNPAGEAVAHGCARGSHLWTPPGTGNPPPQATGPPGPGQQEQLARLLRQLNITLAPIAKGSCDHRHREDRYTPSRKLRHLIRARTSTCCAPGCGAQAFTSEIDHTIRYPVGDTCEHNLAAPCTRHHKAKHAPGWKLTQPEPGVMKWTVPSGRTYETRPTVYDV